MGCGNPPAIIAAEEGLDELAISTKPNGANGGDQTHGGRSFGLDIMTPLSISSGDSHFPLYDMLGDWQSYRPVHDNENYHLSDYSNPNFSNDSKADESLINGKSDLSEFCREPGTLYRNLGTNECSRAVHGHNTVCTEYLVDKPVSSDGYKSELKMNFMPLKRGSATGYPIKMHGAEAKRFKISTSPMDGKFSSPEFSTSALPHVENFGVTRNESEIDLIPFPIRTPQKVDGSFLTLGIGDRREVRQTNNFNPQEVANKLEGTVFLGSDNSHVGQGPKYRLIPAGLTDGVAIIGSSSDVVSSSAANLAGRMVTLDAGGYVGNASASLKSMQFSGFQNPQANAQPIFSANYNTPLFDPAPPSLPFRTIPVSQSECVTPNSRGPRGAEITMSTQFSSQSIPQKQFHPSNWHIGSSYHHGQQGGPYGELIQPTEGRGTPSGANVHFQPLGNLTLPAGGTRTEVARQGSPIVQPVGHFWTSQDIRQVHPQPNSLFHERSEFPVLNWKGPGSSAAGPFPKRLGVQPTDFSIARANNVHFQRPMRPPFSSGPPTNLFPWVNPFSSPMSSGQQNHGVLAHLRQIPPVSKFNFRPQASPIVASHSLMKRPAMGNPPATHTSQRRKILPQPAVHSSPPYDRPKVPASVHIPPSSDHVKWEGFEEPLEPTGYRCYLCKRDLSYTTEGPMYQPPTPIPVSVLPCGHTFHDHCLQRIMPENQSKDPPCIPCAIGET